MGFIDELLNYEREILSRLHGEGGLVVLANGLGTERIIVRVNAFSLANLWTNNN